MQASATQTASTAPIAAAMVDTTLQLLDAARFQILSFPPTLEDRFEADTRQARSHRMWFEGLVAILGLNACLLVDYAIVRDLAWLKIVEHTLIITPLALTVNMLVRLNPIGWLRESSIAAAMILICIMNLIVEGTATTSSTLFGAICVLITALFVGVVMRLRFPYVLACISAMLPAGLWFIGHASSMNLSEAVVGDSLMFIGIGIILVASQSLEREERRNYLLRLQHGLQAEELASANASLQRLSSIDKLTGLSNRRALEERFDHLWESASRTGHSISAIVLDVDHFKRVNDLHGHLYGDETLRRIGTLLPQALRSPEDMAARYGGEEFILLLPHAEPHAAITVAERTRHLIESAGTPRTSVVPGDAKIWITISCGVSSCVPTETLKWTDLVAAADQALYSAKRNGRNRVEFRDIFHPQRETTFTEASSQSVDIRSPDPESGTKTPMVM